MKTWLSLGVVLVLVGCESVKVPQPVVKKNNPQPQQELPKALEPIKPIKVELAIADDGATLQAWRDFRTELLPMNQDQRDKLLRSLKSTATTQLQTLLIRLHPDSAYTVRFAAQTQLSDKLNTLPKGLADLLRWDLAYNQKLLESESAVTAISRLNAQQQSQIDRLNRQNKDLQKKIDALTQIEAKLNQTGN